ENTLLNLFNNFYAMPYGHVESDIYNTIGDLERFVVSNAALQIRQNFINDLSGSFTTIDSQIKADIDNSIGSLRSKNIDLVNYSAIDLVDLSHTYFSWKCMFNIARAQDRYSEPIPAQLIKEEAKYFVLNI